MTLLFVRVALTAACGGFAAYVDARTRTIPDLAWLAAFAAALVLAIIGGWPARISALTGALCAAVAFLPGLLLRSGGQPMVPLADYLLGTALGALSGLAALRAVLLVTILGFIYGVVLLAAGRRRGRAWAAILAERPPFAPILACAFVAALTFQVIG